jgi:hypothetical protein
MLHEYRLEGIPDSIVIKAGHLVVASRAPNRLQFINLESESVVGSIDFGFSDPTALCASDIENPYVYCFSRPRGRPNTFYQIDVSKREVVNQLTLERWLFDSICDAEMSVDGKRLAIQLGNAVPGSQVAVIDFQEDAYVVRSGGLLKRSPGKLNRGWRDRSWLVGSELFTPGFGGIAFGATRNTFGEDDDIAAVHPTLDLVVTAKGDALNYYRWSNGDQLASRRLPDWPPDAKRSTSVSSRRKRAELKMKEVAFDMANHQVFFGQQYRGVWIPLEKLGVTFEPRVAIEVASEVELNWGQPLSLPLKVTGDRERKTMRLSISSGPEAATISNETLLCTPKPGDIGIQEIQLSLSSVDQATPSAGTTLDKRTVTINIAPPHVDLGFPIEAIRVSRNRRRAIAWGGVRERPAPGRPVAGPKNLAIIDLQRREVLATKQVPAGIRLAEIDNEFVYLLPAIGQTIYRLDHSLENPKTTVLQSRSVPSVMQRIAGDRLLVEGS